MTQAAAFNPTDPAFVANPYPFYQQLRALDPVYWGPSPMPSMPLAGAWYVTRYADVQAALREPRFGHEWRKLMPPGAVPEPPEAYRPYAEMNRRWLLFRDPPDHTRLRTLVNAAFTPRMVEQLRPRVTALANELLDQATGDTFELLADYAYPLPMLVIAELLGYPAEDRAELRRWSNAIARAVDIQPTPAVLEAASQATLGLTARLREVVAERRRNPREDLISGLIAAEDQHGHLTEDELLATCVLVLGAGHETTANLIGNGTLALLQHPAELARLRAEPGLLRGAVEELLRYDAPIQMALRFAFDNTELGGKPIQPGQALVLLVGAANRDPERFPDPDRLDITRPDNRPISFGAGPHYCLGAPLARLEGEIAFTALVSHFPHLRLAGDQPPAWRGTAASRGLVALPLVR